MEIAGNYTNRLPTLVLLLCVITAACVFAGFLVPEKIGFYHDDSLYVVTAQSLASGNGYRIISLPGDPVQTKYPPLYPALLSLVWSVYPDFPNNAPALILPSLIAMIAFLGLGLWYLIRWRYGPLWLALAATAVAALNWRTALLATSTLSEPIYAALSVVALWMAEKEMVGRGQLSTKAAFGICLALTVLCRTSGISLLAAVFFYFLIHKKLSRILLPTAIGALAVTVWFIWCYLHPSTNAALSYYTSYLHDWRETVALHSSPDQNLSLTLLASMVIRNVSSLAILMPTICLGLPLDWYQSAGPASQSGVLVLITATLFLICMGVLRDISRGIRILHIYILFYLALHIFWPYSLYDRFLIPVLPFLLVPLFSEIRHLYQVLARGLQQSRSALARLVVLPIVVVSLGPIGMIFYSSTFGLIRHLKQSEESYLEDFRRDQECIAWLEQHTYSDDVLVCYRDPTYFLYAGRKAIRSTLMIRPLRTDEQPASLVSLLKRTRATYLIQSASDFELDSQPALSRNQLQSLLQAYPDIFIPEFATPDGETVVYKILVD